MWKLTYWKRLWCYERLKVGGKWDVRGWDGWMASWTRWTWVWGSSRSWWWTGKPGVLQSMESQRVRHDWATELNWCLYKSKGHHGGGQDGVVILEFCLPCHSGLPWWLRWLRKNLPTILETWVLSLGWEDLLEESMATYSSILAWRIPMDRGAWWDTVHGVANSQLRLSS